MKMSGSGSGWKWNPSKEQRMLFGEWREFVIIYLVSCREGTYIKSISDELEARTGELIPLEQMGFPTINQFLYEMRKDLEIRIRDSKLFIFVRESAVPSNYLHIRKLALEQAKDISCKTKDGLLIRPSKNQTLFVQAEILLTGLAPPVPLVPLVSVSPTAPKTPPQRPIVNDAHSEVARNELTLVDELLERVKALELRNQQLERKNEKMQDLEEKNRKLKQKIRQLKRDWYSSLGKGQKKTVKMEPEDGSSDEDYYYEAQENLVEEVKPMVHPKTGNKKRYRRGKKSSGSFIQPGIYQQQGHALEINSQLTPKDLGYYQCSCGKGFQSGVSAYQHADSKTNFRRFAFKCNVCYKTMTTTSSGFLDHNIQAHGLHFG